MVPPLRVGPGMIPRLARKFTGPLIKIFALVHAAGLRAALDRTAESSSQRQEHADHCFGS